MNQDKTEALKYISNLQKKILSLKADCKRKDELLKRSLDRFELEGRTGTGALRESINNELKEK